MKRYLVAISVLVLSCSSVWPQDAPMFRGDVRHSGVYQAAGLPKFNSIKWKFQTNGRVISSPTVVSGVTYFGSTDCNLYAVDVESGALKWKFETKGWVVSSPAVASGVVYFLSPTATSMRSMARAGN